MADNKRNMQDRRKTDALFGRRKKLFERRDLRSAAELKLEKIHIANLPEDVSIEKLLYELQVHQIELEMQNEELRHAHVALEESRDQYLNLFEFAPVGYITLSEKGLIQSVNFTAASLLGTVRKKLLSRPLSRFVTAESADDLHLCLLHLLRTSEKQSAEVAIKREDGVASTVHLDAVRALDEEGKKTLRVTLTDITKRKQVEEDLRIAAAAFQAQEGIMVTDAHNMILRVNQAFTRITGYTEGEAVGQQVNILKSGQHDISFYKKMWQTITRDGYWQGEIWNQRKNGEKFPAWMSITAVLNERQQPTHYVGSFLDITLQKKAERLLLDAREYLEKEVEKSALELGRLKDEHIEVHAALKVMMKLRETEGSEAKDQLVLELKQEVLPFLQHLKQGVRDATQLRLIKALDENLQRLVASYGSEVGLVSVYKDLTPKEIQVASMVREGASTKVIAATLSLSPETISIHRKNIRKKLGLENKSDNLRSYLISLHK